MNSSPLRETLRSIVSEISISTDVREVVNYNGVSVKRKTNVFMRTNNKNNNRHNHEK